MRIVPLIAAPNQSLNFIDPAGNRWALRIKIARTSMFADVSVNEAVLLEGQRFAVGTFLIPHPYLATLGNFALITDNEQSADWEQFGITQTLLYITPQEQAQAGFEIPWSVDPYPVPALTAPTLFEIEHIP